MWSWLKDLLAKLFSSKKVSLLPPAQLEHHTAQLCRDNLVKAHLATQTDQAELNRYATKILTEIIPSKYKDIFEDGEHNVCIHPSDVGKDAKMLLRVYPLVKRQLEKLGITDVIFSRGTSSSHQAIIVDIRNLSKAVRSWAELDNAKEIDATNLHKDGIYR